MAGNCRHRWVALCGVIVALSGAGTEMRGQTVPQPSRGGVAARETAQPKVTVNVTNMLLVDVLRDMARQAGLKLFYSADLVPEDIRVSLRVRGLPVSEAFSHALAGTGVAAVVSMGQVVLGRVAPSVMGNVNASSGIITGTVREAATRQPLAGATIFVDDAARGVRAGDDGRFRIVGVVAGTHLVRVRRVGYLRAAKSVQLSDGASISVDFALEESTNTLEQVVVTGTVVPTELRAVPSAMTVITAKQLEQRGITQLQQLFRGDVPGLFAVNKGAENALDEVLMFSRGGSAFNGSAGADYGTSPIKTYVDGIELANPKYLSQIDPRSIERIEILTGPQASTIYGSNALNGVMQIFTKRGTSAKPQLTLNLMSGIIQNNFTSGLAPWHDYGAQLNGVNGDVSYNIGSSWNFVGAWTPSKQTTRADVYGGARLAFNTSVGPVTGELTMRRAKTLNRQFGEGSQGWTTYQSSGWYSVVSTNGVSAPQTYELAGQTIGATVTYAPKSWWSHVFGLGQDLSNAEQRYTDRSYTSYSDTTLYLTQTNSTRNSQRYVTTVQAPVSGFAKATVTLGVDAWQNLGAYWYVLPQTLTGTLTGTDVPFSVSRQPGHNSGGFVQTQFGILDRIFVTYGLRAEWNPTYGEDAQPNYAPRYGIAYVTDIGALTAKVRGSYGRSTRPPAPGEKAGKSISQFGLAQYYQDYGNFYLQLENPDLAPEFQQGGEGGLELYFGRRGSLVVTRYNQTVDNLLDAPVVDSARTLFPVSYSSNPSGYAYTSQYQYLNMGSVRNQGWELQGNVVTGPLTTRGTYSWTKSRTIGINPKYLSQFSFIGYPQYHKGATFRYLPEHTWAVDVTYATARTTVGLAVNGVGRLMTGTDELKMQHLDGRIRLRQNNWKYSGARIYMDHTNGYAMADLNVSRRLSDRFEITAQVQNLTDRYLNEWGGAPSAAIGRQTKAGARIRL
jgi:outer membrane receptor protein involved in Fe transport